MRLQGAIEEVENANAGYGTESPSIPAGFRLKWSQREGAERFADRRRREDDAPRLLAVAPKVQSIRLQVEERRAGSSLVETAHVRQIIVARAPALFFFPCQDSSCKDGGHDVTASVLAALRAGQQQFEGEDACHGQSRTADCGRVLRYVATATYAST